MIGSTAKGEKIESGDNGRDKLQSGEDMIVCGLAAIVLAALIVSNAGVQSGSNFVGALQTAS